ncbi:MAG: DUF1015 domain-containing protein [Treponema sp.]|jgi:hypothetical protein|nr:DUF1015 domain-containing protein [Treponema sp.]
MNTIEERLAALGTAIPDIRLPGPGIDLSKWAVIACDQFTQDRAYWEAVAKTVGDSPSSLNLIFPELYLGENRREERIRAIHRSMAAYLGDGTLSEPFRGCVYVERSSPYRQCRRGLVLAIDLERYDWQGDSRPLIRSTEGTVPERLPPRMAIRRSAPLETPHILLLIDDDTDSLIPALGEGAKKGRRLYQTPLMLGAGDISGWALDNEAGWQALAEGLEGLARRSAARYGSPAGSAGEEPFLFAVGDGNHSLATAKAVWDEYKAARPDGAGLDSHPARYALVEVENIYDSGIAFEPIHRVIFDFSLEEIRSALEELPGFSSRAADGPEELSRLVASPGSTNRYGLTGGGRHILVETAAAGIATEALQPLLDRVVVGAGQSGRGAIDYIHGKDELFRIAAGASGERPAVGILLPPVKKPGLFQTVAGSGPLPRKSFSMGEAEEKRFYLECRELFR